MHSDLKYWYLHDHKLFRNLSFDEIDALCILKRFRKSRKNELLDLPFGDGERVYLLKHGTIKLLKMSENGEELLIDIFQKGDLFGDLNLEKSSENTEFFKVVSNEAIICTFRRERLEEVMRRKPDFALSYIKFIGFSYKKIQNSYKNILFKDARTRLILLLQSLVDKEKTNGNTYILPNYLTQKDLAQLICTTRQTVIALLKELDNEGILRYSQKELEILDVAKFQYLTKNVK